MIKLASHFLRYDTRCYFNVRSKADLSQLNLPHVVEIVEIHVPRQIQKRRTRFKAYSLRKCRPSLRVKWFYLSCTGLPRLSCKKAVKRVSCCRDGRNGQQRCRLRFASNALYVSCMFVIGNRSLGYRLVFL